MASNVVRSVIFGGRSHTVLTKAEWREYHIQALKKLTKYKGVVIINFEIIIKILFTNNRLYSCR